MTKSQGAMQIMCEELGVENFYSVTFTRHDITAQGRFNTAVICKLQGFEPSVDSYGYITFTKEVDGVKIRVAFTD